MKKEYRASDHTFAICAYKESPYLEALIESIKNQTVRGSAFVVTSTPNAHIEGICKRSRIPYAPSGLPSAIANDWNFGYDVATTALVTIAHQDDVYEPCYLEAVLDAFNNAPAHCGAVHTDYFEIRNGTRVDDNRLLRVKRLMNACLSRGLSSSSPAVLRRCLSFGTPICCPSVTFDKLVCGPSVFDARYANSCDWQTWVNLASRGIGFSYVPVRLMGHRIYAESTTTQNIESNVRSAEDLELLESLWPRPVAKALFRLYSTSEASNEG